MWITWKHEHKDFSWPLSFEDKVEIFCERIYGWQLNIADVCSNGGDVGTDNNYPPVLHSGFAVLSIVLSYFETIAKYEAGFIKNGRSKHFFRKDVYAVFPNLHGEEEEPVDGLLEKLYQGARCGLYHASKTAPGIALGQVGQASMAFSPKGQELIINPHLLPKALKEHLAKYRRRLLNQRNMDLRSKFERRFDVDLFQK